MKSKLWEIAFWAGAGLLLGIVVDLIFNFDDHRVLIAGVVSGMIAGWFSSREIDNG